MRLPAVIASRWEKFWQPKPIGKVGERIAEKFLKRQGYHILARGLLLRGGELDLIAVDGRTVVFVEVKTRRSLQFGTPADAVDQRKQFRMTKGALYYLKRHGLLEHSSRFDVVAITWPKTARKPTIEHFKNAFPPVGYDGMFA